jgi:Carboxypeptidase regulatory-like domain
VRLREIVVLFLVCLLSNVTVLAQSPNGAINGLVLDPSGKVIVGADITIVNDATGVQYAGKTNAEGIYVVTNLPPGPYRLQVSMIGFKTLIKPDIVLNVQDALAINFTLPVGAVSETVTVQGGAPLVNTESASVSTVIDRNLIENLPLNGRSFNTLLQLTPGVVIAQIPVGSQSPLGQFSIAGQRTDANNFTVDGVSANFGVGSGGYLGNTGSGSTQAFSALGGTSSLVSVDALQEFRVETSSFAPEFGRAPGGQVILTTQPGTNEFHGALFDYFRNTVMDANDWFANQAGDPRAPEHHNDFGGVLGGPIWRDKTFFFFSYEGARLDLPQTGVIEVPSEYARSSAPTSLAPFLDAYPQPNDRTVVPGIYDVSFTGTYPDHATLNATSIRIDHTINSRFAVFGRFNDAPSQVVNRLNSLSDVNTQAVNTQTLTLGLNMLLSTHLSNAVRANYSTQGVDSSYALDSFGGAVPLSPSVLLGSLPTSDSLGYFGLSGATNYFLGPYTRAHTTQLNFTDELDLAVGAHGLKFGGDYRAIFLDQNVYQNGLYYYGPTVQQFLSTGTVDLSTANTNPSKVLSQSLSLYAQDTWKATSRLTMTYGLRWELSPAPSPRDGTILAAWANVNDPATLTLAPIGTPVYKTTYTNFAPRLGIALKLTDSGDFVLRAGVGVFYDLGTGAAASIGGFFPNSANEYTVGLAVPISDPAFYIPAISLNPPYGLVQATAPNLKLPRSYQWNVALERSFPAGQVVSATYVGQAGRDLLRNEALDQPNADFSSAFQVEENDARSNYNALQLQYRRPLSSEIQALFNYTYSHSLDNESDDVVTAVPNVILSAAHDYASSTFDVRQSFSGALVWNIPGSSRSSLASALTQHWSLDSVIVARTGFPFNAVLFGYSPGGYAWSRPDLVPGQPLWVANPTAPGGQSLNPNAFAIPSAVRQGTEGRNDIPGFGLTQIDLSAARKFPITERLNLQFRVDAFNLFNHPNFLNPYGYVQYGPLFLSSTSMLNEGLGGLNPLFQEGGPRSLQLSLKLLF